MNRTAALYHRSVSDRLLDRLEGLLSGQRPLLFYRADDIGVPDVVFQQLAGLFLDYGQPLCPALVPAWLDAQRWRQLKAFTRGSDLFCWHQHGYTHRNHEASGRKSEFGDSREAAALREDILRGRDRLERFLGTDFCPVFTPPWNRCSAQALDILVQEGFLAVSRWQETKPTAPLVDLAVNVDLHTLRQETAEACGERLVRDWQRGIEAGRLGIMLHHQCMNEHAFDFLERIMSMVDRLGLRVCTFRELAAAGGDSGRVEQRDGPGRLRGPGREAGS